MAIATLLQAGIIALGGAVAYQQWTSDKAMELQKKWTAPAMEARRDRFRDVLLCRNDRKMDDYEWYLRAIYPDSKYVGQTEDLPGFLEFYNAANTCIDAGVCDKTTTCLMFGDMASTLQKHFFFYIKKQQSLSGDFTFATDIGRMAERCAPVLDSRNRRESGWFWSPALGVTQAPPTPADDDRLKTLRSEHSKAEYDFIAQEQQDACRRLTPAAVQAQNARARRATDESTNEE